MTSADHVPPPPFHPVIDQPSTVTIDRLRSLGRVELKHLYWNLSTPSIEDIAGEYDAVMLCQGKPLAQALVLGLFNSRGRWMGKAFRPDPPPRIHPPTGRGYNVFGTSDNRFAKLPIRTEINHSQIIPGMAYILRYDQHRYDPIRWLVGELRVLTQQVVLGFGTYGPRGDRWTPYRRVIPFALVRTDRPLLPFLNAT